MLGDNVLAVSRRVPGRAGRRGLRRGAGGGFRRFAGYALPPGAAPSVRPGDGLLGQAAKENRPLHVPDVPDGYLPVASEPRPRHAARAAGGAGQRRRRRPGGDRAGLLPARAPGGAGAAGARRPKRSAWRCARRRIARGSRSCSRRRSGRPRSCRPSRRSCASPTRSSRSRAARCRESQAQLEAAAGRARADQHRSSRSRRSCSRRRRTSWRASQATLTEKAAELERANQYKTEFLANMSHELRTPLNSSLILAKLLADNKDGNLTAEQVKFAQTISSAGNDLLALINDILDLSKIEAGKVEVDAGAGRRRPDARRARARPSSRWRREKGLRFAHRRRARRAGSASRPTPQRLGQILQEPAVERAQVHRAGRGVAAGRRSPTADARVVRRARHRHRHPAAPAGHHLRGVPPGRRQHAPQVRRHRSGAVDFARPGAAARRRHHGRRARPARAARSR